jgi:hypothetical protein
MHDKSHSPPTSLKEKKCISPYHTFLSLAPFVFTLLTLTLVIADLLRKGLLTMTVSCGYRT